MTSPIKGGLWMTPPAQLCRQSVMVWRLAGHFYSVVCSLTMECSSTATWMHRSACMHGLSIVWHWP